MAATLYRDGQRRIMALSAVLQADEAGLMAAAISIQAVGVTVYNLETARPSFSFSLANGQRLAAPCTWCATTRTFYAATKENIMSWDLSAISMDNARLCAPPFALHSIKCHRLLSHPVAVSTGGTLCSITLSKAGKLKVSDTAAVPLELSVDGAVVLAAGCGGKQRIVTVLDVSKGEVLVYNLEAATGNLQHQRTLAVDLRSVASVTMSRTAVVFLLDRDGTVRKLDTTAVNATVETLCRLDGATYRIASGKLCAVGHNHICVALPEAASSAVQALLIDVQFGSVKPLGTVLQLEEPSARVVDVLYLKGQLLTCSASELTCLAVEDGVAVPTLASVLGTLQPPRQTVVEAHNFADTSRYKTEQELTAAVDALSRTDSLRLAPEIVERILSETRYFAAMLLAKQFASGLVCASNHSNLLQRLLPHISTGIVTACVVNVVDVPEVDLVAVLQSLIRQKERIPVEDNAELLSILAAACSRPWDEGTLTQVCRVVDTDTAVTILNGLCLILDLLRDHAGKTLSEIMEPARPKLQHAISFVSCVLDAKLATFMLSKAGQQTWSRLSESVNSHLELCEQAQALYGVVEHLKRGRDLPNIKPAIPVYSIELLEI